MGEQDGESSIEEEPRLCLVRWKEYTAPTRSNSRSRASSVGSEASGLETQTKRKCYPINNLTKMRE